MPRADRPRAETFLVWVGSKGVWVARFAITSTPHSMEPEPVNIPNPLRGAAIAVGGLLVLAGVALASGQGPSTGSSGADPTATAVEGFLTAASPTPSASPDDDQFEDGDDASTDASPGSSPDDDEFEDGDDASTGANPSSSPDEDDDVASNGASPDASPDDEDEDEDDDDSGPGGDDDDQEDDDNSGPGGGDDDEHDD
jgi:hypothetical protein